VVLCFFVACAAIASTLTQPDHAPASRLARKASSTPLYFMANGGQMDARALFCARTPGYTLWLTRESMVFDRIERDRDGRESRSLSELVFKNAGPDVQVTASDPSDYRVSYFFGRDEAGWRTDIPTSRAVLYKGLYEGIDLKAYGTYRRVEYDWIVAPGARPGQILFSYSGTHKARLDDGGNLAVETAGGRFLHCRPSAYQVIAGRRVDVEAAFRDAGNGSYGFDVGTYDPRHELTIDPLVLAYSTYLGGSRDDFAYDIVVDQAGAAYVLGTTVSRDFPPGSQSSPQKAIFVSKLSPDGGSLVYTAFFSSQTYSEFNSFGLFVDAKGFAYIAGPTESNDFPIKNAFQSEYRGAIDGFVLKLSRDGKSLVYSSYIGGGSFDHPRAVCADSSGAAYVGGHTFSRDFPVKNAFQKNHSGNYDVFVAKVAPDGKSLVYSTLFGTSKEDACADLFVDNEGAVTFTGVTGSPNLPVKSAFQKKFGGGSKDGFVAKLAPTGNSLIYASFLGGPSYDYVYDMNADRQGNIYIVGHTYGNFPQKNAFQKSRKGSVESFIAKIAADGKSLVYSSYLGGSGVDSAYGVAVDEAGAAHIAGHTKSRDFPVKSPVQAALRGSADCFLTVVDPSGLKLLSSTYLGGTYRDYAFGLALDSDGAVFLCGETNSADFPVLEPYQSALAGDDDAVVLKLSRGENRRPPRQKAD
jgi:hypothetical protein